MFAVTGSHVLPPTPDDEPHSCSLLDHSFCGIGRSCEPSGSHYYCLHKTLFPIKIMDVIAWLVVGGCCLVAATAGIGGGGLNLPILILILNFTTKEASVLSNIAVLGNCIGQLLINISDRSLREKCGDVKKAVLMILPALIAGGSVSIAMEGLVPSTMILILALATLLLASFKTYCKAAKMREQENNSVDGESDTLIGQREREENLALVDDLGSVNSTEDVSMLSQRDGFCNKYIIEILIALCWSLNASTFFVIHSELIEKCSISYYCFVLLPIIFAAIFLWVGKIRILQKEKAFYSSDNVAQEPTATTPLLEPESNPAEITTEMDHNEIIGNGHNNFDVLVWWLPVTSSIVGFLAALLGIGGGELVGPMLLLLNMRPEKSSATTATISLLNSATNTLHHASTGMIISPGYASSFVLMGFLGGLGGRSLAMNIAMREGKASIIAFSLFLVLCVASGLVAFELFTTPISWEIEGMC